MILTNCAACAAPLAHDAPRCVRCKTRYCNSTCQHDHWRRGHKQICKKIHRGGNAEQYNADTKFKEAVAEAVEECADDTKGQKCYICLEAVHPRTGEGLVRRCTCGDRDGVSSPELSVAHVSCLAEQAKILVAEGEENNVDPNASNERWARWYTCSLCEQQYHGVVACALGWACWKTYLGRPDESWTRLSAMAQLGNGLEAAKHLEEALSVREAGLSMQRRIGVSEISMLGTQSNLAGTYFDIGRIDDAIRMRQEVYFGYVRLLGVQHASTLTSANNYAASLLGVQRFEESKALILKTLPVSRRVLGEGHDLTLKMRWLYASALFTDDNATPNDVCEAVTTLEDAARIARRVLGGPHPTTAHIERALQMSR